MSIIDEQLKDQFKKHQQELDDIIILRAKENDIDLNDLSGCVCIDKE